MCDWKGKTNPFASCQIKANKLILANQKKKKKKAPLLAFATSSSAATLPRSLQVAENAKVHPEVYNFVLPLGAAINMVNPFFFCFFLLFFYMWLNCFEQKKNKLPKIVGKFFFCLFCCLYECTVLMRVCVCVCVCVFVIHKGRYSIRISYYGYVYSTIKR